MQALPICHTRQYVRNTLRTRPIVLGLVGGLIATLAIDLVVVGLFPLFGTPADVSFSVIGDTAAGFFSLLDIELAGGVPLGAAVHYLTGLSLGALFGAAVSRVPALHVRSTKKGIGLGVLYTEVTSLSLLVTAPIILNMTTAEAAQWFGVSFVMHMVYGGVLGLVVTCGQCPIRTMPSAG